MADVLLSPADEVSKFLHSTCLQRNKDLWYINPTNLYRSFTTHTVRHPVTGKACRRFPEVTGSAAELYIEPMLSCVGDVDIMYYHNNELAVPKGRPLPTQLPENFDNRVRVLEIVDGEFPGYVYMVFTCVLRKNCADGKSYLVDYISKSNSLVSHSLYVSSPEEYSVHGPAYRQHIVGLFLADTDTITDLVPCIHCLDWPPQAAHWPKRHRNHEWPNSADIDKVLKDGCDVVGVAHPICKEDDLMRNHQWRLSFSRAEVVLLNSWLPEQQIVYHMLRIFMKSQRLTEMPKNLAVDAFSNYHIKTLMLWACERYPPTWWTYGSNLVSVGVKMMHFLNEWLINWRGEHYFINTVHFSDHFSTIDIDTVSAVSQSTTEDSLSKWFVDNYIPKCAEICPDNISVACADTLNRRSLQETLADILKWRDYVAGKALISRRMSHFINSHEFTTKRLTSKSFSSLIYVWSRCIMHGLTFEELDRNTRTQHLNAHFWYFMLAFVQRDYRDALTDVFYNLLTFLNATHRKQPHVLQCLRSSANRKDGASAMLLATTLMKSTAKQHRERNAAELLFMRLSKGHLLRALKYNDSTAVYFLGNIYLAILQYLTGQFQLAIDHCILMIKAQDHTGCKEFRVQGDLLPKFDDDIDNVLGLTVLYQHVRAVATEQQSQDVGVFTTELFAHYLLVKHLFVAKCSRTPLTVVKNIALAQEALNYMHEQIRELKEVFSNAESLCVGDLMLYKISNKHHDYYEQMVLLHNLTAYEVVTLVARYSTSELMNFYRPCTSEFTELALPTLSL